MLEDKQEALGEVPESHVDRPVQEAAIAQPLLQAATYNRTTAAQIATQEMDTLITSNATRRLDALQAAQTAYCFIGEAAMAPQ